MLVLALLIFLNQILIVLNYYKTSLLLGIFNLIYFGVVFYLNAQDHLLVRL